VSALDRVAGLVREEGGLLADAVAPARGEAAEGPAEEMAVVVEAIREGYELHYGRPRILVPGDPDLALLAGDRLYALGLERLAALGDLEAVALLADLISDSARAHAEGRPAEAEAAWEDVRRRLAPDLASGR
jgi:hypothetical protein